ncbi:SpoIIIAH-like family protein [Thomasclavelia sp.]|uniref:SpoIIIAH-like family protein n=1 Tax=Thomasclavelia sp. TaxID=3025757 RepID=UPI0025D82862|nr:SpoIIIAH-like family protein [Thomasclavelia sp.]
MNRQAITFLTLFSLILVLSIYYVLLPPETDSNEVAVSNEEMSQIEILQETLDQERADLISENNAIIASSESNSDEIASALATISEAKETAALEKKITKIINDAGFKSAFVEVENKIIKVVVDKKDANSSDANNIIKTIMDQTGNEYQVEVKFISDT